MGSYTSAKGIKTYPALNWLGTGSLMPMVMCGGGGGGPQFVAHEKPLWFRSIAGARIVLCFVLWLLVWVRDAFFTWCWECRSLKYLDQHSVFESLVSTSRLPYRDIFSVQCNQAWRMLLAPRVCTRPNMLHCGWAQQSLSALNGLTLLEAISLVFYTLSRFIMGFPGSSDDKASAYNAGDPALIPGSGRSPEEGNGNPLQYSCLENPMDWGSWQATVHKVAKSQTRLSDFTHFT